MLENIFSFSQIMGYVAYAITIVAFWQKKDKKLLLMNALATVFWVLHFGLLGAWAGALTEALVGLRSVLSALMTKQKQRHLAGVFFVTAFVLAGVFTCHRWQDWTVVVSCLVGTISMIYLKGIVLRYGMLVMLSLWLLYNCFVGSIGGTGASATLIIIQAITLFRMYKDKKYGII